MEADYNNIPSEVMWVATIKYSGIRVSIETYNKMNDIIDKYPQYFQWEHKYNSIPSEVHEAFDRECYPQRYEPIVFDSNSEGILAQMNKQQPINMGEGFNLLELFEKYQENLNKEREAEIAKEKRVKAIWKKHYSKYKLKYRS